MDDKREDNEKKFRPYNAGDLQKIRLEKLMKNIDKPIEIPTQRSEKKFASPPEFVRNVMGSSAGAGSGEFHVYRHLRRKEYARLHFIETQAKNEELDAEYHRKIEENRRKAEEATAKKRLKRLKKKEKLKKAKLEKKDNKTQDNDNNEDNNNNNNKANDNDDNSDQDEDEDSKS